MDKNTVTPMIFLMVEDNKDDAYIVQHTLQQQKLMNDVYAVYTAADALDFLHQRGKYHQAPRPNAILMDIRLGGDMNGLDLAKIIRNSPILEDIPIVILSGSDEEFYLKEAKDIGIDIYVKKPFSREKLIEVVDQIEHFWLQAVECKAC